MVRSEVLLSPSYLRKHFARDWDLGIPASAAAPRVAKQIASSLINSILSTLRPGSTQLYMAWRAKQLVPGTEDLRASHSSGRLCVYEIYKRNIALNCTYAANTPVQHGFSTKSTS